MKFCLLMGSPRPNGNTAELIKPFISELRLLGAEVAVITLFDKRIGSCKGCYACQEFTGEYGCRIKDDMQSIVSEIVEADCFVLATPIYTWYCPPEMKAMLDRFYGMNKYYGNGSGSLWEGKKCAIIATHGDEREHGAGPFERGIQNLCSHSKLEYAGMYSVRDLDNKASFQTPEAIAGAREFAHKLLGL